MRQSTSVKVKTCELKGLALDWVVDTLQSPEPLSIHYHKDGSDLWIWVASGVPYPPGPPSYSSSWALTGPLIEREGIEIFCNLSKVQAARFANAQADWRACMNHSRGQHSYGTDPILAALRCYVAYKLGEKVQVPAETLKEVA